jgi:3-oxoacyl-[acyl-carrier protein] reductase
VQARRHRPSPSLRNKDVRVAGSRQWRFLVFGASGAIGSSIASAALQVGWHVTGVSRQASNQERVGELSWVNYDPISESPDAFEGNAPFDAVCWAQGANLADSFSNFDRQSHLDLYDANCLSVLVSLAALVERKLLSPDGARLVIVSSIWQERARQNKLSYTITKAAVGGIVRAASVDLGVWGHLVNGVLPGVLDTPMTRANLSSDQIDTVEAKTTLRRLPDLGTLAQAVLFLCSESNRSVTGQSLAVDLGMSNVSLV